MATTTTPFTQFRPWSFALDTNELIRILGWLHNRIPLRCHTQFYIQPENPTRCTEADPLNRCGSESDSVVKTPWTSKMALYVYRKVAARIEQMPDILVLWSQGRWIHNALQFVHRGP